MFTRLRPIRNFNRSLATRSPASPRRSSEQGLTLIEVLMAILVIAITGALITPPLMLAAATRIQNRRAEQAQQIAQGEIDRVRTLVSRGEHVPDNLPATVGDTLDGAATPGGSSGLMRSTNADCNTYEGEQIPVAQVLEIDVTGDCEVDFVLQAFRTDGLTSEDEQTGQDRPTIFDLGVRVYAVLGDIDSMEWGDLETEPASLQFTNGQGNQRTRPLAVLNNEITWSDNADALACGYYPDLPNKCN